MEWFNGVPASVVLEQSIDDDDAIIWWLIEIHVNEILLQEYEVQVCQ